VVASMFKKYDSKGKGYIDMADLKDVNKRLK
jgi:Ca2+-binding EF-hand superfamily protein